MRNVDNLGEKSKNYRAIWRFIIIKKTKDLVKKAKEKEFPFRSALFILLIASRLLRAEEKEKKILTLSIEYWRKVLVAREKLIQ